MQWFRSKVLKQPEEGAEYFTRPCKVARKTEEPTTAKVTNARNRPRDIKENLINKRCWKSGSGRILIIVDCQIVQKLPVATRHCRTKDIDQPSRKSPTN